ncbi:30S ribosomal protein S13 [Candidatus Jorgensenbacteria bacterium RIFCSPLOWO2_01_FULL_45_25b]|uniref:Small ribosomal subunit protein uS13 n=1 Tax=Candidatus Jorgensenbacteria bacterium RIFCSPLOWO2_01_FULL_45_25b TaxID=1798471 RepID=A0A1F6BTC9_9BACT|nr:MAG: 30S ribosomal protein S13 [Candidatus Jorgensenbacteria bacterium RIFCSPLOWO2_01_FULL_45_25b]
MRIQGIDIPDEKKVEIALTYIYGIGLMSAKKIIKETGIDIKKRAKELTGDEISNIAGMLAKNHTIEGELRQVKKNNIARLKDIKAYRGIRHMRNLPSRGQRTKTNSRTVRGNVRKTAGSGKKKVGLK